MIAVSLKMFPLLVTSLHLSGSFYLFCGVVLCCLPLMMLVLPETKDRSINQINDIYTENKISDAPEQSPPEGSSIPGPSLPPPPQLREHSLGVTLEDPEVEGGHEDRVQEEGATRRQDSVYLNSGYEASEETSVYYKHDTKV